MLEFNIRNQTIEQIDRFKVVANSRNYLFAKFNFLTDDWTGIRTAVFEREGKEIPPAILDENDMCLVPWEWLQADSFVLGQVSVFSGDLVTANKSTVEIFQSGYKAGAIVPPTPDVYTQLVKLIGEVMGSLNSLDLDYTKNVLQLVLNGEKHGTPFTITGGSGGGEDAREIELQNDGVHIQWRYVGEAEWNDLIALADLKGEQGKDGVDGENGIDGQDGRNGTDGKSAFESAQEAGYTGTEADFYAALARVSDIPIYPTRLNEEINTGRKIGEKDIYAQIFSQPVKNGAANQVNSYVFTDNLDLVLRYDISIYNDVQQIPSPNIGDSAPLDAALQYSNTIHFNRSANELRYRGYSNRAGYTIYGYLEYTKGA